MNIRKRLAVATAAVAMTGGLAVTPALAASGGSAPAEAAAVTCKNQPTISTGGGKLDYKECWRKYKGKAQSSTQIWLKDTKADGKCAYGKVSIGSWSHTWKACPKGKNVDGAVSGWHNGGDARVELSVR
ncbi:hypothetical protein ACFQ2B_11775 [Streptomyces stramineus]